MKKLSLLLGVAALSAGLVGCQAGGGDDAPSDALEATSSTVSPQHDEGDAAEGAAQGRGESPAPAPGGAPSAEEIVDFSTADGVTHRVPAPVVALAEDQFFGPAQSAHGDPEGGLVVTFPDKKYIAYTQGTGAQPVIGSISDVWFAEDGLDGRLGAPVEPEAVVDGGWTQPFEHGTITWTLDPAGQFQPTVDVPGA